MTMSDTGEGMGGSVDILFAWPLTVSTEKNIDMIICLGVVLDQKVTGLCGVEIPEIPSKQVTRDS